jgi:hypothetical protein
VNSAMHTPPDDIKHIYRWYKKAQIDYVEQYIRLYIAYNAWYRQVTGSYNDREAISMLKKRFVVWDDYCNGRTLVSLNIYVDRLARLTNERPLPNNSLWDGTIKDVHDWKGLIEFWYQVRCFLVHGSDVPQKYVWLAYETLDIFMAEIVRRMQLCFTDKDYQRLEELSVLVSADSSKSERFRQLQRKLQAKYIDSPDIWQVDMQRAES